MFDVSKLPKLPSNAVFVARECFQWWVGGWLEKVTIKKIYNNNTTCSTDADVHELLGCEEGERIGVRKEVIQRSF